jgi:hypothetical protein
MVRQERRRTIRRAADRGEIPTAHCRDSTDRLFAEFGHQHAARSLDQWMSLLAVVIVLAFATWGAWSAAAMISERLHVVFAAS